MSLPFFYFNFKELQEQTEKSRGEEAIEGAGSEAASSPAAGLAGQSLGGRGLKAPENCLGWVRSQVARES